MGKSKISHTETLHVRGVSLECSAAQSWVGAVVRQLPGTETGLHDLVGGWGPVNEVGDPGVPYI